MATANDDITKLRQDIEQLRKDISSVANSLKEIGSERGHDLLNRAKHAGESLRTNAEKVQHKAEAEISGHPIASVLTSFGMGFLIGMILDSKRR